MKQVCKYNPNRDIQKCCPGLSTSIALALESGIVLDTGIDCTSNDIDQPSNVWGRIQDVFTALDVQKKMFNSGNNAFNVKTNVNPGQPASGETE